jgi:hypothetical protein
MYHPPLHATATAVLVLLTVENRLSSINRDARNGAIGKSVIQSINFMSKTVLNECVLRCLTFAECSHIQLRTQVVVLALETV